MSFKRRKINSLANDYDYAFSSSELVYSKKTKRKIRKDIKRGTHKLERRESIQNEENTRWQRQRTS